MDSFCIIHQRSFEVPAADAERIEKFLADNDILPGSVWRQVLKAKLCPVCMAVESTLPPVGSRLDLSIGREREASA